MKSPELTKAPSTESDLVVMSIPIRLATPAAVRAVTPPIAKRVAPTSSARTALKLMPAPLAASQSSGATWGAARRAEKLSRSYHILIA